VFEKREGGAKVVPVDNKRGIIRTKRPFPLTAQKDPVTTDVGDSFTVIHQITGADGSLWRRVKLDKSGMIIWVHPLDVTVL